MCQRFSLLSLILCACGVSALLTACATTTPISPELAQCMARTDRFVTSSEGTVLDNCTQLIWMSQDYRNVEGKAPPSYEAALFWVDEIKRRGYADYRDWRMPTRAEYQTLYDAAKPQQSYQNRPIGYTTVFAAGGGEWYWTSDVAEWGNPANHVHTAWIFKFTTGKSTPYYTYPSYHTWETRTDEESGSVRLVRTAP